MSAIAPRMDSDDEHTSSVVKRKMGGHATPSMHEAETKPQVPARPRKGLPWLRECFVYRVDFRTSLGLPRACTVKAGGASVALFAVSFVLISLVNAWRFHMELCRVRDAVRALQLPPEAMPVLVPAYSRPEYLRPVLQAIVDADGFDEVSHSASLRSFLHPPTSRPSTRRR